MNTCDKLPLYLYNEMNEQEKKEFENHAQICHECRNSVKVFAEIKDPMRLTSAPLQTINAIFEKTTRKKSSFSFAGYFKTWKVSVAFAAGLLVGVCAFSLKDFSQKNSDVHSYGEAYYSDIYYTDASFEEIESINYELDEMENYFMV